MSHHTTREDTVSFRPPAIVISYLKLQLFTAEGIDQFPHSAEGAALQVYWTKEVGEAISTEGFKGLAKYGDKCTAELNKIVGLVRGQLTSLERATCGALVVIDVHARDITVQVWQHASTTVLAGCL